MSGQQEIRVRIGTLTITAGSAAEARRIAEALPAALERALRDPAGPGRDRPDQVARVIAEKVRERL